MTGGGESWLSWVFKIVNFLVLAGILVKFGGKALKGLLVKRRQDITEKLEEAERVLKEAEELKNKYEQRITALDDEMKAYKETLIKEAQKESDKLIQEAASFKSRVAEQIKTAYEQELREALTKIREEVTKLTMENAERLIYEKLTKQDHERLVKDFVEKLRSTN